MLRPLAQAGKTAVIPPKANRKEARAYDKDLYKARHLIENFFAKLKQYRAIATRYARSGPRHFIRPAATAASPARQRQPRAGGIPPRRRRVARWSGTWREI